MIRVRKAYGLFMNEEAPSNFFIREAMCFLEIMRNLNSYDNFDKDKSFYWHGWCR